jgi:hypothetical protein
LFKRAERQEIARWAILAKEPDCADGRDRVKRIKKTFETTSSGCFSNLPPDIEYVTVKLFLSVV